MEKRKRTERRGFAVNAKSALHALGRLIRAYPSTLVGPLLLLSLVIAVGVWGVHRVATADADSAKTRATSLANDAATWYRQQVSVAMAPVLLLTAMVEFNPSWDAAAGLFAGLAPALMPQTPPGAVRRLMLAPAGVIREVYPLTGNEKALGLDLLNATVSGIPQRYSGIVAAVEARTLTMNGPYTLLNGGVGIGVNNAIFIKEEHDNTFNRPDTVNPYCGAPCAYNNATEEVFWGLAGTVIDISALISGSDSPLKHLVSLGYRYHLEAPSAPADMRTVASTPDAPTDPVEAIIKLPNNEWVLRVSPGKGWRPAWYGGLIAAVVVVALVVSLLAFAVLVSRRKHQMLLQALLPKELLEDAMAHSVTSLGAPIKRADTPADMLLGMMAELLEGRQPHLNDVVFIRTALLQNMDVYQPLNLKGHIKKANLDNDVTQALMRQLGAMNFTDGSSEYHSGLMSDMIPADDHGIGGQRFDDDATSSARMRLSMANHGSAPNCNSLSGALTFLLAPQLPQPLLPMPPPPAQPASVTVRDAAQMSFSVPVDVQSSLSVNMPPADAALAETGGSAVAGSPTLRPDLQVSLGDRRPGGTANSLIAAYSRAISVLSRKDSGSPHCSRADVPSPPPQAVSHSAALHTVRHDEETGEQILTFECMGELAAPGNDTVRGNGTALYHRSASGFPSTASHRLSLAAMPVSGGVAGARRLAAAAGIASLSGKQVQLPPPPPPVLEEVEQQLSKADEWHFDAWRLNEVTHGHALSTLGFYLLHREGLISQFRLNPLTLARFLRAIEAGYNASNPYHNAMHAADVLQTLHVLLHGSQLHVHYLDRLGLLSAYLAAIIHDHAHPGLTNDFLIATSDPLAVRYNDRSPLENHHCASAFALMLPPHAEFDVLAPLSQSERSALRKQVIELVMATDMKQHFAILSHFNTVHRLASYAQGTRPRAASGEFSNLLMSTGAGRDWNAAPREVAAPRPMDETERLLSLQVALKVADIGHLGEELDVHVRWLQALEEEFFSQGDRERELGLPISPLFDRAKQGVSKSQVGFYEFVALPLVHALTSAFPGAKPLMNCFVANYDHWRAVDEKAKQLQVAGGSEAPAGASTPGAGKAGVRTSPALQRAATATTAVLLESKPSKEGPSAPPNERLIGALHGEQQA